MTDSLVVLSYLTTFGFGAASGWWLRLWAVPKIAGRDEGGYVVQRGKVLVALLIAFLLLVGFGVQQSEFQKQAGDRDTCVNTWAKEVVTVLETRSTSSAKATTAADAAAKARTAKDDTTDAIFLLVASAFLNPPENEAKSQREFATALRAFVTAKRNLVTAETRAAAAAKARDTARDDNPFPKLHC